MNGQVDSFGRALVTISLRASEAAATHDVQVWIDTGFNGDLVLPQQQIDNLGLPEGTYGAGPYQILLDEQPHWSSSQIYAREDQGEQISVSIPPGHKTITLKLLGNDSIGAWADAGFLK